MLNIDHAMLPQSDKSEQKMSDRFETNATSFRIGIRANKGAAEDRTNFHFYRLYKTTRMFTKSTFALFLTSIEEKISDFFVKYK